MYPSVITTFTYPQATDRLNNPSHSALERNQSSAIGQIQAFVGTTSSAVGTLMYDVRAITSDGGGHVQTAVKGGTSQTTYTKGDILVATGPSVLAKLAVSSTAGEVLTADPNQAAGMKWANTVANKVFIGTGTSSIYNSNTEQVLFAASVIGSTLGTNNAVRFKGNISNFSWAGNTFTLRANYGNNQPISLAFPTVANPIVNAQATVEGILVGDGSVSAQRSFVELRVAIPNSEADNDANVGITKVMGMAYGTASVASNALQNLVITGQFSNASPSSSILTQMFIVEKIT